MDDLGLTALLVLFLTQSLRNEIGLMTFVSHGWHHILGFRETIFWEIVIGFLSAFQFYRDARIWSNDSAFSFRLGGAARSCSLIELGQRLDI